MHPKGRGTKRKMRDFDMAHCVWSPVDYPAAWEKQAEESSISGTEDDTAADDTLAAAMKSKA